MTLRDHGVRGAVFGGVNIGTAPIITPPPPPPTSWAATSLKTAIGGSAYSGQTNFQAYETHMGRTINFMQIFPVNALTSSMTSWLSTFDGYCAPTFWMRTGGRQSTITFTLPMLAATRTAFAPNAAYSGDSLASVAASSTAYQTTWEHIGQTISDNGLDTLWPDGRYKVVLRIGHESQVTAIGNRFWPHQYWDATSAANYKTIWDRAYGWAASKMTHPENVGWAFGIIAGGGSSAVVDAAWPTHANLLDYDIYDDNFRYNNGGAMTQAQKLAVAETVWTAFQTSSTGLDYAYSRVVTKNIKMCFTEWANQIRNVPQFSASDSGGGDNPIYMGHMRDWVTANPLAGGRLYYMDYTWSDVAASGTYLCKLDDGHYPNTLPVFDAAFK